MTGQTRSVQLSSSIRELLGDAAPDEAFRRLVDATESSDLDRALLWFDAWTQLEAPARRR